MTRNIYLKGRMGKLFGTHHRLNCKTVQEAMHAIDVMKGGLRQYLIDCTENGVKFTVQKGEDFLSNQTAGIELGKDDIIITPVPSGKKDGIKELIIGIILIIVGLSIGDPGTMSKGAQMLVTVGTQLALQGIVKLTADDPEELDEGQNSLFQGPINNTKSGVPVPLCFGKMEVGGAVINFGFTDYRITGNQGYTFVSKGSGSGSGGSGGGGGGGGSRGGGDSDWRQEILK